MRYLPHLPPTKLAIWLAGFSLIFAVAITELQAQPELTNQAISDKIEEELTFDPGVNSTQVYVFTRDGIVTLNGQVNNLLAKERAVRIADTVKGVRAIVDEIKVVPSVIREDIAIGDDVRDALLQDPATESFQIMASVSDGKVTLDGTVDSYQERDLALKRCWCH